MNDFADALRTAVSLIVSFDIGLRDIVVLSLAVSLTASACAFVIGAPLGTALAVYRFRGRGALVVIVNALLGLPPVVVGLAVYLLLSRSGPLGSFGILFTPTAMVIAQCALGTPIVIALTHRMAVGLWATYGDALLVDGAARWRAIVPLMRMEPEGLLTAFLAAFGRAIAEVGAILIVGGNIRGYTRTMTTAIALETSKGDLALALGLGLILILLSVLVSAAAFLLESALRVFDCPLQVGDLVRERIGLRLQCHYFHALAVRRHRPFVEVAGQACEVCLFVGERTLGHPQCVGLGRKFVLGRLELIFEGLFARLEGEDGRGLLAHLRF